MLVFIDESGHPRPGDPTKRPVILAACIKESDMGRLTRLMFTLRRELLAKIRLTKAEREGKAVDFLNRRSLLQSVAKREFMETVFNRMSDFDVVVFAIVMERPAERPYEGPEFLQLQFRWLLERVDRFMEREHSAHWAVPIFDGQDPSSNQIFAECFTGFMARHVTGRAMQHVVPSPLFVDSIITPGIQIADLFAYVLRLDFENELHRTGTVADPYLSAIKRFSNIVHQKTINYEREDGQGIWHGISKMDASRFVYEAPTKEQLDPGSEP